MHQRLNGIKHKMRITLRSLLFLNALMFTTFSWSLNSDNLLPYVFSADAMAYHRNPHCTVYTGHVHIQQGTSELIGEKVIVYFSNTQNISKLMVWGKPAQYTTLPDNKTTKLFATANQIVYNASSKTADLIQNATMKQDKDTLEGEHLCYDMTQNQVRSIATAKNHHQTLIILQPQ